MENKAFGIDLGTTYSCISYVDDVTGEPVVVDNMEGTNVTPSIVYFEDDSSFTVGDVAKESAVVYPESTCEFVKRKMGIDKVAITVGGKDFAPELVSLLILRKLVADAETALDTKIEDVVITCPAYFGIAEKTATQEAGKLAGLNVLEIINEPTAAALCYGSLRGVEDKVILVYDLGGGTFDVTIIRVTPKEIVAIATDGNHQLGGKDWDKALMEYLEDEFRSQKDFDDAFDLEATQDLQLKAEKAKQQLTAKPQTKVIVMASGVKASIEVTRETFDDITSVLLRQTIDKTKDAIAAAAKKGVTGIDEIILVGGSCKMPQVKAAVETEFADIPIKMFEPNTAVAKGAAIHADNLKKGQAGLQEWKEDMEAVLEEINKKRSKEEQVTIDDLMSEEISGEIMEQVEKTIERTGGDMEKAKFFLGGGVRKESGPVLRNITSKSFGVEVLVDAAGGRVSKIRNLITKQDPVPVTISQEFGTAYPNQQTAEIVVYETDITDEVYDIDGLEPLGTAILELPGNLPEDAPIEITFGLTTDGLLKVRGFEKTSNKECRVQLQSGAISTEEEIAQMQEYAKGITLLQ